MRFATRFAATALSIVWPLAANAEVSGSDVLLAMKISRNGEQVVAPRIVTSLGKTASIASAQQFKLVVTPTEADGKAMLRFELEMAEGGQMKSIGKPAMLTEYGKEASISVTTSDGIRYGIAVTPTKSAMPTKAAAET